MSTNEETLLHLCSDCFEAGPSSIETLPAAGGDRIYYRLKFENNMETPATVIGVIADSMSDAKAFVELSKVFSEAGVDVPRVYAHTPDYGAYLEQDLGSRDLFSVIRVSNKDSNRESDEVESLVGRVIESLVKMQTIPEKEWCDCVAYKPFSRRQVLWDLNYFKYEFLKNMDVAFDEDRLEDDFERLADELCNMPQSLLGFMMRDCQSRNIMLVDGKPYFIDYQGGRCGPGLYDAVSLLWQAKAGFSGDFRKKMLSLYAARFAEIRGIGVNLIIDYVPLVVLFRTLQVLGAYGFRGLVQKRAHFIESIPPALKNLTEVISDNGFDKYPELRNAARQLAADTRFSLLNVGGRLHVKVFSFSYKRGYPEDLSGNGGGFMFDCRGMHNPGRYDEYKQLTGLDRPVIDFLKDNGEIDPFVERAVEIVSPTVDRYIKRGFSSLQIGFGCTGGRHRSVYSAEAVARALAAKFPEAVVELCHREQNINRSFNQ